MNYLHWLENECVVIVQIEHVDGVENLAEILAVEGVHGFLIGPYDLSASLGVPGQLEHPKMVDAMKQILTAAGGKRKAVLDLVGATAEDTEE